MMVFKEWWAQYLKAGGVEHFNLMADEESARAAWEAATKAEREACAKMADERIYQGPDFGELANDIRERSKD